MKLFKRIKPIMSDSSGFDYDDKAEKCLLDNENKVESINRRRRAVILESSDSDDDSKKKCYE